MFVKNFPKLFSYLIEMTDSKITVQDFLAQKQRVEFSGNNSKRIMQSHWRKSYL